jgi:hypothetical protein
MLRTNTGDAEKWVDKITNIYMNELCKEILSYTSNKDNKSRWGKIRKKNPSPLKKKSKKKKSRIILKKTTHKVTRD